MTDDEMIERADRIAAEAHAGQIDKAGAPYISHPRRVSATVNGTTAKVVALLHDVVEDGPGWTLDRLKVEGFPDEVVAAVDALTHREGEDYFDAVRRAGAHPIARIVKLADLSDNSDRTRLGEIGEREEKRLEKYARATAMLTDGGALDPL
ncbi:HD domain-containing protein [Aureimonas sp. SK2]|uniref:HD domain-containing protein n=1 Tax=Aureimonas sp. SK2 TaxID=3015992 RepID=UPI002443D6C0|nr:HD domain-containing protein [Aureimonas sp. SK2]